MHMLDTANINWHESGVVISMADGVATVSGLDNVLSGELLVLGSNNTNRIGSQCWEALSKSSYFC